MKLAIRNDGKQNWHFVLLESTADVMIYKAINEQIKAKQSVNLYFGFKSQTYRASLGDYAAHEIESDNKMAHVVATAVDLAAFAGKTKLSLLDYCGLADGIINSIHTTMLQMVHEGKTVRINENGGYCSLFPDDVFDTVQDINEIQLHNFLLHKQVDVDFKITAPTLVIENGGYVPQQLIQSYLKLSGDSPDNLQIISSFKQKTLLFKDVDYLNLFRIGRDNGLRNIVFETTGQDKRQMNGLRDVLQALARKDAPFNIYVKSWRIAKELDTLDYDRTKITITVIN